MDSVYRTARWGFLVLLGLVVAWMAAEVYLARPAHTGFYRGTPQEMIVVGPGRAITAFYVFMVLLTLLPALWTVGLMARLRRPHGLTTLLLAGSLAVTSAAAGFAYEALQTEIRLSLDGIDYREGIWHASMPWKEMTSLRVRWGRGGQSMEIGSTDQTVRIDLSAYSPPDKMLLVTHLPRIAGLNARRPTPDGWTWVRRRGIRLEAQ